jgi:hypothetical protein
MSRPNPQNGALDVTQTRSGHIEKKKFPQRSYELNPSYPALSLGTTLTDIEQIYGDMLKE